MLIPKNKRKETVINPFRPNIGIPRQHSVCSVGWGDFHIEYDEVVEWLRVDCDHNEEFVALLEATIPKEERYRCQDREVYLIEPKWKRFVVESAKEYFDDVKTQLREW